VRSASGGKAHCDSQDNNALTGDGKTELAKKAELHIAIGPASFISDASHPIASTSSSSSKSNPARHMCTGDAGIVWLP